MPEIFSRTTIGMTTASVTRLARSAELISLELGRRSAVPLMTRASEPAFRLRQREPSDRLVVPAVRGESGRLPRADGSPARHEERRPRAVAAALVQIAVEDVDLRARLIERAHGARGNESARGARGLLAAGAQQLRGHHALQVLIETLEEPVPAAVGLQTQTIELLSQSGKPLGESSLDFGFETPEAVFRLGIGHGGHYTP